jgi:hypothetical protein
MKRLYIVRIVREAYVLAENEVKAKGSVREIERWEDYPTVTAELWGGRQLPGWSDTSGVYGTDESISLGTAKKLDCQ